MSPWSFPQFCDRLNRFRNFGIEHVGIARCRLHRSVMECLLHEPKIAGRAQELGREVMAVVVHTESGDTRALAQLLPIRLYASTGERVVLALDPAGIAATRDIGEDKTGWRPFSGHRISRMVGLIVSAMRLPFLPSLTICPVVQSTSDQRRKHSLSRQPVTWAKAKNGA